ncbi:MAG: DUF4417 domain-containing protein [Coriobacteriales bacterium]
MISKLTDIMEFIDRCTGYLADRGVGFDALGFPTVDKSWYLDEIPDQMVTYRDRNNGYIRDRSRTVICFFCEDERIYPRFENLFEDLEEYRSFMGVVGADVTVTSDMDIEWQEALMLANQLFAAVLGVSGVKIVQNLRCGSVETLRCLSSVPKGILCASGTLGCDRTASPCGYALYGETHACQAIRGAHLWEERPNHGTAD